MAAPPPLLVLAPIAPCASGNGLAMRTANFTESASRDWTVHVAVVPVAGRLPRCPRPVTAPVVEVVGPERTVAARRATALVADPDWRRLLAWAEPMPPAARAASPVLAAEVVAATGVGPGTPVHVVRSYLAPLGLAVAQRLASPWATLDLDDDDEALAAARGEDEAAAAYGRLVAAFAPRFTALSLASPLEARALARRHGMPVVTVSNAVTVPDTAMRSGNRRSGRDTRTVLFVGNLDYGPNVDAALRLVNDVLPALAARAGEPVRVELVGPYRPDGPLAPLSAHPDVTLTGFVDDLEHHYRGADVVIAPFTTGGGTRIKLLEAFAHQVPVITTAAGMAGLEVRAAEHVLVGETADELAAAGGAVLDSPALAGALTRSALQFVRRCHATPVVAEQVRAFLHGAERQGGLRR